jgi:translation elongation factor EF-Tu-like GTPase
VIASHRETIDVYEARKAVFVELRDLLSAYAVEQELQVVTGADFAAFREHQDPVVAARIEALIAATTS